MNKFLVTLKTINRYIPEARYRCPDAVTDLQDYAKDIQQKLVNDLFKNSNILKDYARNVHNIIMKERTKVVEHYMELTIIEIKKFEKKDPDFNSLGKEFANNFSLEVDHASTILSKISKLDINKLANEYSSYALDDDIQYFKGILDEIDSVLGYLLEFFITYYPKEYQDEETMKHIIRFVSKDNEALKYFLAKNRKKPIIAFDGLFMKKEVADFSLECLKKLKLPVINDKNEYCYNNKNVFRIWRKVVIDCKLLATSITQRALTEGLNSKIKNLKMHEKTFLRCDEEIYSKASKAILGKRLDGYALYTEMKTILNGTD